ncbi:MAG: glycosyltransferase [Candidatus Paceibacterota bacterium]
MNELASINLVVFNGERYVRHCLDSIKKQSYGNIEVNILDNNSSDGTRKIIKEEYPELKFIESSKNIGMWPGQDELLKQSRGDYVVVISVDIILNPNFVTEAVKVFEKDEKIGAVEGKIYSYTMSDGKISHSNVIDTCGFKIFKSRRIINIGHGEEDHGQYDEEKEIFAVEGAVPVFRRTALEDSRIEGRIVDPEYFWYGDDLDLAWRMKIFGWKQIYSPSVIAYHDRKTTKGLAGSKKGFIEIRKTVPLFKRRLDWRNTTLTIIKNDFASNWLRDLPHIFKRQFQLWTYFLFFEPIMFIEIFNVVKLLPKMLKRRSKIMRKARASAKDMRLWFN